MTSSDQTTSTALVTGASRGFGRAIASALHAQGVNVVAVARNIESLASLRHELGERLTPVVADVVDPVVAGTLIEQYRPDTLVLNAGAAPLMRPVQHQTWESFNRSWEVDVRHAFHWIREALLLPLRPGEHRDRDVQRRGMRARRSAAATPGPRRRSDSSPPTPRTSRRGPGSASVSSRCCRG